MSARSNDGPGCWPVIVSALFLAGASFIAGLSWGASWERQEAVRAGAGRWVIDPAGGSKSFTYGTPQQEKK